MNAVMNTTGTRRWWALGALTLSVLAIGLDGTILSVALPTLAHELHATESDLQWFSASYLLTLAAAMLPVGLLGDRIGRKKVLVASLLLFGLGSVACAFAPSPAFFIAARSVLGVAGAGIIVMSLSALTVLFSETERPRAVGVWAASNFLALPIGPILGGWILTNYWWGWVFLINAPVALIGLLAAVALVPESRASERTGLDPVGIVSSTAGLVILTYGIIEAGRNGWDDRAALVEIAVGALLLVGFFLWEYWLARRPGGQPMLDLSLFRSASFTWGVILLTILVIAMIGVIFTMPQFFQGVQGTDAMGSGVRLLPLIGGLVLGAVPADRVARLLGAKITAALGFAVLAGGMFLGARTEVNSSVGFVAVWMAVVGFGMGLTLATCASGAISELSAERAGVGSAVMQALQKVGGPLGTAILGSVLSATYIASLDVSGLPPALAAVVKEGLFSGLAVAAKLGSPELLASVQSAFVDGMNAALTVGAGIAVAGFVLTLIFLPNRPKAAQAVQTTQGSDTFEGSPADTVKSEHEQSVTRR
ncbi:MAG TPA: DHA2 family efflux MFS transporter permease subunit [Ktedonobacterales bacterium]|nr:DHA2 family efflux MFS transporter permease subunit [Ktedonobacterales bacterium]